MIVNSRALRESLSHYTGFSLVDGTVWLILVPEDRPATNYIMIFRSIDNVPCVILN